MLPVEVAVPTLQRLRDIFGEEVAASTPESTPIGLAQIVGMLDALAIPLCGGRRAEAARHYAASLSVWQEVRSYFPAEHEQHLLVQVLCGTMRQCLQAEPAAALRATLDQ